MFVGNLIFVVAGSTNTIVVRSCVFITTVGRLLSRCCDKKLEDTRLNKPKSVLSSIQ